MQARLRLLRRARYGLAGLLVGVFLAYASLPRESAKAENSYQRAAQSMARLQLEQVAAQLQVAAELAHGMAAAAELVRSNDAGGFERLISTLSARDRVAAVAAWGVSERDACRPRHCAISFGSVEGQLPDVGSVDSPLSGFSDQMAAATIVTGNARFLIGNPVPGRGRTITIAHGYNRVAQRTDSTPVIAAEPLSAAFVVIDLDALEREVVGVDGTTRLLLAEHHELLPEPVSGQQYVLRSLDGIAVAAYFPAKSDSQSPTPGSSLLWLAIVAASVLLALIVEYRSQQRGVRDAVVRHERDTFRATAEALAQISDQCLLLCDTKSGNVVTGNGETVGIALLLERPGFAELQALTRSFSHRIVLDQVRVRVEPGRVDSGTLTIIPIPRLGASMALLKFTSRSRLDALQEQIQRSQRDDALTGLLCRRAFIERLSALISEPARPSFALVGLEVASLGMINALHGLEAGDLVLQRIAQRLLVNSRDLIFAGRIEDDLLACAWAVPVPEVVAERINQISNAVRGKPVQFPSKGGDVAVDVDSWVAATFVGNAAWCDSGVLLSRLGEALSRSRTSALRTHLFSVDGAQLSDRAGDAAWLDRIRQAMRDNTLVLFGQKVIPRSASGLVAHAEILVRMRAADGSIIPPGAFLPIAERYELIRELDRYVVARAFRNLDALVAQFAAPDGVIAINLSARTLSDPGLLMFLQQELQATGIDPARICLEVTESAAFGDLDWTCNLVAQIRKMGLRVAIDDFGVGMASFSYLQRVPADYVKIDGSFVKDMTDNVLNRRIVEAVTEIGHAVNMRVIAEWVASAEICDALERIGVDYLQGFHLHAPQIASFEIP